MGSQAHHVLMSRVGGGCGDMSLLVQKMQWKYHLLACHHLEWCYSRRLVACGSDRHQYQWEFDVLISVVGCHVFPQDSDDCLVAPFYPAGAPRVVHDVEVNSVSQEPPQFGHYSFRKVGSSVAVHGFSWQAETAENVVSAVSLVAGRHSTQLVNAHVTVRRYYLPLADLATGPTQSIWIELQG